jgi:hypothetical protein
MFRISFARNEGHGDQKVRGKVGGKIEFGFLDLYPFDYPAEKLIC